MTKIKFENLSESDILPAIELLEGDESGADQEWRSLCGRIEDLREFEAVLIGRKIRTLAAEKSAK